MHLNRFRVSTSWLPAIVLIAGTVALPSVRLGAADPAPPAPTVVAGGTIEGRVFNSRNGVALENARVSVEGSPLVVFTDPDGVFRLPNLPAGQARLRVFFTGLVPQTLDVAVARGETVQRDITLSGAEPDAAPADGALVKLDRFVVDVSREMNATAIAINEQRFASNIKDVVTTDEYGAVAEGNVAEFLKFLPGVTVDLSGGDSRTVSLDGAPAANTPITIGGINLPAPGNNDTSRAVEVGFFNLNNVSRIEVWQSPTPESPGSSLAGSVNLVPRSSFERTRPVFNGSVYLMMRDDLLTLGKRPNMYRDPRRVVHPGFDLAWTVPVNRQFGFSVAAGMSSQFSDQIGHTNAWRGVDQVTNGNAFPHTVPGQPYLSSYTIGNAPKQSDRRSFGATIDYRLSRRDRLALSFQYSAFDGWTAARNLVFNTAQVQPGGFTPFSTRGVAGAGNLTLTAGNGRVRENRVYLPSLTWRHDGPVWKMEGGVGRGYGTNLYRDMDKGLLLSVQARRTNVTVNFDEVGATRPGVITVIDNATRLALDPYRLETYALNQVTSNPRDSADVNFTAFVNARRDFLWRVPVTVKAGLDFRQSQRDIEAGAFTYSFRGADGRGNLTNGSAAAFLDPVGSLREGPDGFPAIQFPDYKSTLDYFRANPSHFVLDENAAYRAGVNQSKFAQEGVSAIYLQGDVALLGQRLRLNGGVRVEQTNIEAEGPLTDLARNVQRDASGRPLLDAAGRPLTIATDALAISRLTLLPRAARVEKEYLRYFPRLNASYNLRENLIARGAVYQSIGAPNFNQYAGGVTLPNTDNPPGPGNRIAVNNAAIKPWTATSVKFRLEYYFEGVGQISAGVFRRDYKNFFGNTVFPASPEFLSLYALDSGEYGSYDVSTQYNLPGTVRSEGWEVSYKQALTFLPHWARGLQVFGNYSSRRTKAARLGSLGFNEIPHSGAWGVSLTRPRFNLRVNATFRDAQNRGEVIGNGIEPETYNFTPAHQRLSLLGEYYVWRRFALFANLNNITDVPDDGETYGPSTPEHARLRTRQRFGALWTLGVKGTF